MSALHRSCGTCTLCCRLVPVSGLDKPANTRCRYQSRKGCSVHAKLEGISPECRIWSCRWLVDAETHELTRPDRAHYVIDILPDMIGLQPDDGVGERLDFPVIVIWIDPAYPDAHRDPALRRYLATKDTLVLVRYANDWGLVLVPPNWSLGSGNDDWIEKDAGRATERTVQEEKDALGQALARVGAARPGLQIV